jgi:hypothetical protein
MRILRTRNQMLVRKRDLETTRARIIAEECKPSPLRWRAYRLLLRGLKQLKQISSGKY